MTPAGAAPWRRLAPLAVLVLAAHVAMLEGVPRRVEPARPRPMQFATRTVVPPAAQAVPEPPRRDAARRREAAAPPQPLHTSAPSSGGTAAVPAVPATPAPPAAATPTPAATARTPPPAPAAPAPPAAARTSPTPETPSSPLLALPPPVRLHYEVAVRKGLFSLAGHAVLDWRHDGRQYEARLEAAGIVGSRVQRSTGRITPEGLAPAYFSDKSRSEQATHFDRANGRLVFSNNRPEAALESGMQDRLSVILQLAALLAGQPANYPAGTQIAIPTASTREADTWVFAVEGEEDLALPGGAVHVVKLQRLPRREYDQKVELWLAPRMDYAPVRLRLTNPNGDTVDNRWSSTDKG